jgi:hypothetical protein
VITTSFPDYWRTAATEDVEFLCDQVDGKAIVSTQCQLDSGAWTSCSTTTLHHLAGISNANHAFRVRATDVDGNTGTSLDLLWGMDNVAPTIDSATNSGLTSTSGTFAFTGSDNAGGSGLLKFECKLNTGSYTTWTDCSSPKTYGSLTAATPYVFSVRATDIAGNVSSTVGTDVNFTTTGGVPVGGCTISPRPSSLSRLRTQPLFFSCNSTATIASVECMKDSAGWTACSGPTSDTMSGLADGAHTFAVRYVDSTGTRGGQDTATWTVDATAPTINITSASTTSLSPSFGFAGADVGSGVDPASYLCQLEEAGVVIAPWTTCVSPKAYTSGVVVGENYTFKVKVSDLAGNESAPANYGWIGNDGSTPSCVILTSFPGAWRNNTSESISYHCSAATPGLTYECLDKWNWVSCGASSYAVSGLVTSATPYEFRVRATDTSGNVALSPALNWKVDLIKPVASITQLSNSTPTASFSFPVTDQGGSGVNTARTECQIDGFGIYGAWHACQSTYTGFVAHTDYTIRVRGYDNAGNMSDNSGNTVFTWTSTPPYVGPECQLSLTQGTVAPFVNEGTRKYAVSCVVPTGKALDHLECKYDSGAWNTCSSPLTIATNTSTRRDVFVRGVDTSGVTGPVDTETWNVDLTAPTVTVTGLSFGAGSQVFFAPSDAGGSGIDHSQCRFEKGTSVVSDWANCTSPFASPQGDLAGASFTFRVKTWDGASNVSTETIRSWSNGSWTVFGACQASTCGGTGIKTRTCSGTSGGGLDCLPDASGGTTAACVKTCPPTTLVGGWGVTSCSKSCGGGIRYKYCAQPSTSYTNSTCLSTDAPIAQTCNTQACPKVTYTVAAGKVDAYDSATCKPGDPVLSCYFDANTCDGATKGTNYCRADSRNHKKCNIVATCQKLSSAVACSGAGCCTELDMGKLEVGGGKSASLDAKCPSGTSRKEQRYESSNGMSCTWDTSNNSAKVTCANPKSDTENAGHIYITCCL